MGIINKNRNIFKEALKRGFDPKFWLYRLRWNYYPKLNITPKAPCHIDIELTNACNLRCIMCVHGQEGVKNQGFMEKTMAKRIIDEASALGIASMKFNWRGEATMHKALPELIKYAKDKGILEVQLNTNGTLMNDKMINLLIDSGLDRIIFSLDSASKEVYERIRVGAKYDDVMNAAKKMFITRKEAGLKKPFIRIQMVKMKNNAHEEKLFIERWKNYTDEVRVSEATDRGQGKSMLLGDSISTGRRKCSQPWQRVAVSWEGKVYPCCADYFEKWQIGDARTEKLKDIWTGPRMNKMRTLQKRMELDKTEPCASCFWSETFKWKKVSKKRGNV